MKRINWNVVGYVVWTIAFEGVILYVLAQSPNYL
jgi:hypothetical protein